MIYDFEKGGKCDGYIPVQQLRPEISNFAQCSAIATGAIVPDIGVDRRTYLGGMSQSPTQAPDITVESEKRVLAHRPRASRMYFKRSPPAARVRSRPAVGMQLAQHQCGRPPWFLGHRSRRDRTLTLHRDEVSFSSLSHCTPALTSCIANHCSPQYQRLMGISAFCRMPNCFWWTRIPRSCHAFWWAGCKAAVCNVPPLTYLAS